MYDFTLVHARCRSIQEAKGGGGSENDPVWFLHCVEQYIQLPTLANKKTVAAQIKGGVNVNVTTVGRKSKCRVVKC